MSSGTVAPRVEIEFVSDRLAGARLAQAYQLAVPEHRLRRRSATTMTKTVTTGMSGRVAAIYARVSSERQQEEGTVQSQLAGLRELAVQRGLLVYLAVVVQRLSASA